MNDRPYMPEYYQEDAGFLFRPTESVDFKSQSLLQWCGIANFQAEMTSAAYFGGNPLKVSHDGGEISSIRPNPVIAHLFAGEHELLKR